MLEHNIKTNTFCRYGQTLWITPTYRHKFLISHNSFIEWDLNFDVIENAKKSNKYVFVPDDWLQIVYKACKYFTAVNMTNEKFVSVESMNAVIKDDVKGVQNIQWCQFKKAI
jgi:hypothetical protein